MSFSFKQGDRPLEGYTIQRGVGRGGFGEVYHALSDGGKEVALKYLRDNPQIELRGVQNCLNLKSPYLVTIYDVKQNPGGEWFVIMEYVNGPSLRDLLIESPTGMGVEKAAFLLKEIAKGLTYLHDRGIVHRDIKPGNIFYEDGYVKICDYGLSKAISPSQHSGQTMSVGTVHYMAPEVGSGNYSKTIDVYAVGVMLYEMLLGRVPYQGATMGEVLMKHLTAQPEVDQLPAPFPDVIRKALAKDPVDRYADMPSMVKAVFAQADLERSVASFEPASLSTVAAAAVRRVHQQVLVGAGGGGIGTGSSNVGGFPAATMSAGYRPADPGARMGGAVNPAPAMGKALYIESAPLPVPARIGQGIGVTVAVSIAASFVANNWSFKIEPAMMFLGLMQGLLLGPLVGSWLSIRRHAAHGEWGFRLLNTALTAGLLLPAIMSAETAADRAGRGMFPLLGLIFCGKWGARIHYGRQGQLTWSWAFTAALFVFITASALNLPDGMPRQLAVAAATASVLIQYLAGLWPLQRGETAPAFIVNELKDDDEDEDESSAGDSPKSVGDSFRGVVARIGLGGRESVIKVDPGVAPGAPPRVGSAGSRVPEAAVTAPVTGERRSSAVRALWGLGGLGLLWVAIAMFVSLGFVTMGAQGEAGAIAGGIFAASMALFSFSRSFGQNRVGAWRGIIRPLIFFAALGLGPAAGVLLGHEIFPKGMEFIPIMFIVGCGLAAIGVWLIPVPDYQPAAALDEEARLARQHRVGGVVLALGIALFILIPVQIGIYENVLEGPTRRMLKSVVVPPFAMIGTALCITGGILLGKKRAGDKPEKLDLPLQRTIIAPRRDDLDDLIQRHFLLLGYRLMNRSRMLWSFERGNWASMFWSSDIRQTRTTINVAAYDAPEGLRVTCYVDVHSGWGNKPPQKDLAVLARELDELERLITDASVRVA